MPPIHLLIKPASGLCNLRCSYCFYCDVTKNRETASYGIMSTDTLRALLSKAFQEAEGSLTLAFQGGEPTLAGLDFYRQAMALEEELNHKQLAVFHSIQTNGYTLDADWAAFLKEHRFLVGVSLDGTIHTHDAYRKTPEGMPSFQRVMHGIALLKQYGVEYNILTVVNRRTALAVRKIYEFYRKNDFHYLQFIPCLDPLNEPGGQHDYSLLPEDYGHFLIELFELWYADVLSGQAPYIRQFDNYLSILLRGHAESCDMNGLCGIQHVVEADGEVYPCDFWVLDAYRLGNVNDAAVSFASIHEKRKATGMLERSMQLHADCKACHFLTLCRGGCYRYRVMEVQTKKEVQKQYFCTSYQMFFSHCADRLTALAKQLAAQAQMRHS